MRVSVSIFKYFFIRVYVSLVFQDYKYFESIPHLFVGHFYVLINLIIYSPWVPSVISININ